MKRLLILLLILQFGCKEKSEISSTRSEPTIGFQGNIHAIELEGPSNQSNQYDYVGYLHNLGLQHLITNASRYYINSQLNRDSLKFQIDDFFRHNTFEVLDSIHSTSTNQDSIEVFLERWNANGLFVENLEDVSSELNPLQISFYNQINTEIDSFSDYLLFKDNIEIIEDSIINSQLTSDEKMVLLLGTSVARYSAYYWSTISIATIRDFFGDDDFPPSSAIGNILKWDFQGAVAGGIHGLYTGITTGAYVFGPGGVVLSATSGAVLGAIKGSFIDLLWELFWAGVDWYYSN